MVAPDPPGGKYPPGLVPALEAAVPLWIAHLAGVPGWRRLEFAAEDGQVIACHGDNLLFTTKRRGDTARVFNALARGLACAAYAPGGVTFAGVHWEAQDEPWDGDWGAPPTGPPMVDVPVTGDLL